MQMQNPLTGIILFDMDLKLIMPAIETGGFCIFFIFT